MEIRRNNKEFKKGIKQLARAAEMAIEEGLAQMSGYRNSTDLKKELLKILGGHPDFHQALGDWHANNASLNNAKLDKPRPGTKPVMHPVRKVLARSVLKSAHRPEEKSRGRNKTTKGR